MADSLDCFSLFFCCFCCSLCSETSTCQRVCPCCQSKSTRYDIDNDPAFKDPELDAIVERQLYEQRAAWNAAHPESVAMSGLQHPYTPNIAPPPTAAMVDTEKNKSVEGGRGSSRGNNGTKELEQMSSSLSSVSDEQSRKSTPMPTQVHTQPGSGPVMMMKD